MPRHPAPIPDPPASDPLASDLLASDLLISGPLISDPLISDAVRLLERPGRQLLALCGPPAAGKSTLARGIVDGVDRRLGVGSAAYLPLDGFHLSNRQLERLGLADRKGSAPSFDVHGYLALLRRVRSTPAHEVYVPDYDRSLHEPVAARHVIPPAARLVVTEGNYLAVDADGWREVRELVAELWYVDAPEELRDRRLIGRHRGNGSTPERARARVTGNDRPNGLLVQASRERCDRVVAGV
ncbi:nucleoside/nucleotide kinase family protein [Streptacidiphilus sp. EB129]|uniref:nucleoside/nucleotide kinase family protein n=1 Tax=Streptacidiphilus sp. EB129 TaxID=3156262 RepID=UPI003516AC5B